MILYATVGCPKTPFFGQILCPVFGPGHITLECPRLLGFGLGHGGPKSGQGRWAVLDGLMQQYHSRCLICHGDNVVSLKGYERHDLIKCKVCHFVFMRRIPSAEELDRYYETYAYGDENYLSPITIKSYNTLLDEFEKFRMTNKIIDVGCGMGFFLEQAQKRGWEVFGTEYSDTAVEICRKKGINIQQGVLNPSVFAEQSFDVITSFEVIEHINNRVST